jgi:engulfment/cell motility protein 1
MFDLRVVEGDSPVTDDRLRGVVDEKRALKLAPSSKIVATGILASLVDPKTPASTLKLALFNLQRHLKEQAFCEDFVELGGDEEMVKLVAKLEGNSLAVGRISRSFRQT